MWGDSMKRKHISLKTKLAAALCSIVKEVDGKLVPVVPREMAKQLSAGEIISMFEWHHVVYHAIGGSDHHSNLDPLLTAEHREITARKDIPGIAKTKRVARKHGAHTAVMERKISVAPIVAKDETKRSRKWATRAMPGSKASGLRKRMSGKVEKRA
jgi:hypothetical protein